MQVTQGLVRLPDWTGKIQSGQMNGEKIFADWFVRLIFT